MAELPTGRRICHTVEYLHEAILESETPLALHLTTVECSYRATSATRWICRAATDDFDLNADPAFRAVQERIAALGGTLRAERTTVPLRPMPEIVDWLVDACADPDARYDMAHRHASAAFVLYEVGDIDGTFEHLKAAFRLSPLWRAANNLAYMHLVTSDYPATWDWGLRAVSLGESAKQRSLSRYNGAIAAALEGDRAVARELLADAATDLAHRSPLDDDLDTSFLMIPAFEVDHVAVHEEKNVELADAIAKARDVVELAERFERLRGSA